MKLSLIVAALLAAGGLASREAVDAALREAATPAAPERDFRSLIDMARQALNTQINSGRPSNDQVYVCIEAMYADRVVVEYGGKHWQYTYTIQVVDGNESFVLGPAVQVVEQFVPVTAVKEAVRIVEAADGSIEVTIVQAGASINGNYYPDAALKDAVPLFEGVRVFNKSDETHIKGGGKAVDNLLGCIVGVKFVEGAGPDSGRLVGTFKPLVDTDPAVTKMREAIKKDMKNLLGLSIDAHAKTKYRVQGGKRLREATKFTKVSSVDLIVEPGAGGGLDRLTEAAADSDPNEGEKTMPKWKQRMLEAIQAKDAAKHAAIDPATITDAAVVQLFEAVYPGIDSARAAIKLGDEQFAGLPAQRLVEALAPQEPSQRVAEAAGGGEPVTRAELQMIQLRGRARDLIDASKLPAPAKDKLKKQFGEIAQFTEANVNDAIKEEGAYIARMTESGAVRVPMFGNGSIEVGDRAASIRDMLDAFFDPKHKNHKYVHSFREAYIEITGDRGVTGEWRNVDKSRLAESLGDEYRESVDSTTFANALGNSITRRMQAIFTGLTQLQTWRNVATTTSVNDFRTQERFRMGGYANLPAVNQGAAYGALTSPGDAKATYAVTKRGGTEDVTLEAITNDDVGALRRIPMELALAAANTLYEFVFDFYRTNPNASDGVALYHASHNNLFTTALDAAQYAAHRLAMTKQARAGSSKRLGVNPKTLLVPFELQETAFNLFVRGQNLDQTFVQGVINPDIIVPAYWTDTNDFVTVADPNVAPVLEIGFLNGREDPELFVQDTPNVGSMFTNDKLTYKIRHIYGGNILVDGEKFTTKGVVP